MILSTRSIFLSLTIIAACAGAGVAGASPHHAAARRASAEILPRGLSGDLLDGQFAMSESDIDHAADYFLRAEALDPNNPDLTQQTFVACLMADRPEAVRLARRLPENPAALLLLAGSDARAGNWDGAEAKFRALPHQGITQFLQPLLIAWALQGGGHTDAALSSLRPYVEGQRYRAVYALHAGMIADLANRTADAARDYKIAQTDFGGMNLRLAQTIASWQARQGHQTEADQTLRSIADNTSDMSIALPALTSVDRRRVVARATDGIAEAYLALAAALRQQDASEFSVLLLRMSLQLRPHLTPSRLLLADTFAINKNPQAAMAVLAPVGSDDPLSGVVRMRRAVLLDTMGKSEEAVRDLEQIAHDYPDSSQPWAEIGDIERTKHNYAEAIAAYDKAIQKQGMTPLRSSWPLFYARAIAYERSHQWPNAEADLERALQLSPDEPYVLNYLGYSWADLGVHLARAKAMIERAAELKPNDGAIIDSLGWVELRQGDTAGAVKTLERATELEPEDAEINGHLGDAYWAAGRKMEAGYQWRRALTLNPEPDDAAKLEARLHDNGLPPVDSAASGETRVQ